MTTIDPIFLEILQLAMQKHEQKPKKPVSKKACIVKKPVNSILKETKTPKTVVKKKVTKKVKFAEEKPQEISHVEKQPLKKTKLTLKVKKPVKKQQVNTEVNTLAKEGDVTDFDNYFE